MVKDVSGALEGATISLTQRFNIDADGTKEVPSVNFPGKDANPNIKADFNSDLENNKNLENDVAPPEPPTFDGPGQ
ncbi:MAG: hypothetical protein AAF182_01875 [Pseudomonadota bacterium]